MDQEVLRLEGIKKRFGRIEVLRGLDLSVKRGEFITLLGPSGCGKTTTLRIIAGLERADSGRVFLEDREVTDLEPNRRDVNMVFQNYALFPHMNVEQNIAYSLKLRRRPKPEIKKTVTEALALVQLSGYEQRRPPELSGGQRQRVAVARAIVNRPKVLLLDEPLGALDLQLRRRMQGELKRIQQQLGITFIYITHDQEEALSISDRIAVMRDGLFEQVGSVLDIYEHPGTSYTARFVGNANILEGTVTALDKDSGFLVFEHPSGQARAAYGGGLHIGEKITLAVRGEHLEFRPLNAEPPPGEAGGGLRARITGKSFSGGQLRVTAKLKNGEELSASRHGIDSPFRPGDEVWINWALPEQAVLVDRQGSA
jgi:spermidine/putrescine transport system ATP-binding protein